MVLKWRTRGIRKQTKECFSLLGLSAILWLIQRPLSTLLSRLWLREIQNTNATCFSKPKFLLPSWSRVFKNLCKESSQSKVRTNLLQSGCLVSVVKLKPTCDRSKREFFSITRSKSIEIVYSAPGAGNWHWRHCWFDPISLWKKFKVCADWLYQMRTHYHLIVSGGFRKERNLPQQQMQMNFHFVESSLDPFPYQSTIPADCGIVYFHFFLLITKNDARDRSLKKIRNQSISPTRITYTAEFFYTYRFVKKI